jgi:hypothetical protein
MCYQAICDQWHFKTDDYDLPLNEVTVRELAGSLLLGTLFTI